MLKPAVLVSATLLSLTAAAAETPPPRTAPATPTAARAAPAGQTAYSLFEGIVRFSAPAQWPVILEKKEGVPQFIAFQIKDPAAEGSGESSEVWVDAKLLNDATTSQALVNAATDRAKKTPGFEAAKDNEANGALHYTALNGKQRYEYRETWQLAATILAHVRCTRPLLAATSAAWTTDYDAGCNTVMQSLKQH